MSCFFFIFFFFIVRTKKECIFTKNHSYTPSIPHCHAKGFSIAVHFRNVSCRFPLLPWIRTVNNPPSSLNQYRVLGKRRQNQPRSCSKMMEMTAKSKKLLHAQVEALLRKVEHCEFQPASFNTPFSSLSAQIWLTFP